MMMIYQYPVWTINASFQKNEPPLAMNLYELIKKNRFQGFSLQLVRKFAHSMLQFLEGFFRRAIKG